MGIRAGRRTRRSKRRPARPAAWQPPSTISGTGAGDARDPFLAVDARGDAIADWSRREGSESSVEAAARPAGAAWQLQLPLVAVAGAPSEAQDISIDPEGDAVAVWERDSLKAAIIQTDAFDAAGPRLNGLSIPASGIVNVALVFTVSPFDVLSPLGATTGASVTGRARTARASHTRMQTGELHGDSDERRCARERDERRGDGHGPRGPPLLLRA